MQTVLARWQALRENGKDINAWLVRLLFESEFTNIEVVSFTATVNGTPLAVNQPVVVAFNQIAELSLTTPVIVP